MIRAFVGFVLFLLPGFYFHYVYLPNIGFSYSLREGYGFKTPEESDPANYKPLADTSTITRTELVRGIMACVGKKHGDLPYEISLRYADWLATLGYDRDPEGARSKYLKYSHTITSSIQDRSLRDAILEATSDLRRNKRNYYNCGARLARAG